MFIATDPSPALDEKLWDAWLAKSRLRDEAVARKLRIAGEIVPDAAHFCDRVLSPGYDMNSGTDGGPLICQMIRARREPRQAKDAK